MNKAHFGLIVASVTGLIGCAQQVVADPDLEAKEAESAANAVIVGSVNWQETSTLPEGSAERSNSRSVGYLHLPAKGTRCTAFLIAPNVVMTNEHCVRGAAEAQGARVYFEYEVGGDPNDSGYDCSTFIGNDATLDYALLQCAGSPGDVYGVVGLSAGAMSRDASIYVIHQNCDYYASPGCAPTKKYAPGRITSTSNEYAHDADTLGGSSGGPLFSRTTHEVVGLHHVGLGNDGSGRGTGNKAVPMSWILPLVEQRYPGLALGARTPADQQQQQQQQGGVDGYEPNDALASAVAVQRPFSSLDASIDANDVDHFTFNANGSSATITLSFSHAAGDLDLYVFDNAGNELARSIGTTDQEIISSTFGGAAIVRVVGYRGATGSYSLDVR